MATELISVVMPVYKVEEYVGAAIRSVLDQSHRNLELVVVDDGSPDHSMDVVASFDDPRIRAIRLERNRGVAHARNTAIAAARGAFLAFMDSDDVMDRTRLERQLAHMRRRPDIALSGGWCRTLDPGHARGSEIAKTLIDPRAVNASLVFGNIFCTSTLMMRREAVPEGGFRQRYAEDYDFLVRVAAKHALGIVREVLVDYRIRPDSAMRTYALDNKKRDVWASQAPLFEALRIVPSAREREIHLFARTNGGNVDGEQLARIYRWYDKLIQANRRAHAYPDADFKLAASYMWFDQLFRATGCGASALRLALGHALSHAHPQPLLTWMKFIVKASLRREFARTAAG